MLFRSGDRLIVGVDSDFRIKKYKYPNSNRPINNETDRIEFLKSIKYIDEVHLFQDHDHMRQLIKSYQIDTIVVGDDYKLEQVVGRELVKNVVLFPKIIDKSSSNLIQLLK